MRLQEVGVIVYKSGETISLTIPRNRPYAITGIDVVSLLDYVATAALKAQAEIQSIRVITDRSEWNASGPWHVDTEKSVGVIYNDVITKNLEGYEYYVPDRVFPLKMLITGDEDVRIEIKCQDIAKLEVGFATKFLVLLEVLDTAYNGQIWTHTETVQKTIAKEEVSGSAFATIPTPTQKKNFLIKYLAIYLEKLDTGVYVPVEDSDSIGTIRIQTEKSTLFDCDYTVHRAISHRQLKLSEKLPDGLLVHRLMYEGFPYEIINASKVAGDLPTNLKIGLKNPDSELDLRVTVITTAYTQILIK